jgi:hypothetical protein
MAESREQAEEDWRAAWRAEDYSWQGLAQKMWEGFCVLADGRIVETETLGEGARSDGTRPATLQDYWREEEARLVAGDGKLWTRVHLPLEWADGSSTGKANWDAKERAELEAVIVAKLEAAGETAAAGKYDNRRVVGADRRAQFQGAVFLSAPTFGGGRDRAISARFDRAAFCGPAHFDRARFQPDVRFESAGFFESASFDGARFAGVANFYRTLFFGEANFRNTRFAADASFARVFFFGDARLRNAVFSGQADFWGGECQGVIRCNAVRFEASVSMRRRRFEGLAFFDGTQFSGDTDFGAAVFEALASFEAINWPQAARDWHSAFNQTLFRGTLVFTGSGFCCFAAFDGASMERGLQIDEMSEHGAAALFRRELKGALTAAKLDAVEWAELARGEQGRLAASSERAIKARRGGKDGPDRHAIAAYEQDRRSARLRELERGCRALKQAMMLASDRTREHLLFRFELMARRAQADTPAWEKLISHLYGAASDYGASLARPFAALAMLVLMCAGLFWSWGASVGLVSFDGNLVVTGADALGLSWRNVIRPLSFPGEDEGAWVSRLFWTSDWGTQLGVRVLATLESALAITFAFLFALAVRRRFQID